jgi:DNA-binding response OmpR family regulator
MPSANARTVLIIDDEPDVSLYLTTILSHHGFRVETAASADEAMSKLAGATPALVCLDIMMPKESGISVYTRMKAEPRWLAIPVIIVSGVATAKDFDLKNYVADASLPLPDGYFEKPIQIDAFVARVKALTADSQRAQDTHA